MSKTRTGSSVPCRKLSRKAATSVFEVIFFKTALNQSVHELSKMLDGGCFVKMLPYLLFFRDVACSGMHDDGGRGDDDGERDDDGEERSARS